MFVLIAACGKLQTKGQTGRHIIGEAGINPLQARVAKAKTFMKNTLTAGMGPRASEFSARIDSCSTRAELAQLLPDYEKAIVSVSGDLEADMLADRLRKLLA